jgi:hypothetical protein
MKQNLIIEKTKKFDKSSARLDTEKKKDTNY